MAERPNPGGVGRLRDLVEKASPLPWGLDGDRYSHGIRDGTEMGKVVAEWTRTPHRDGETFADAALIVAAVNALPALLDVAEAADRTSYAFGELKDYIRTETRPEVVPAWARRFIQEGGNDIGRALARLDALAPPEQTEEKER